MSRRRRPADRDKDRHGSLPLFEAQHGYRWCRDNRLCAECGEGLTGRRTRWCSQGCVDAYLIRSDPNEARRHVHLRDEGVCAGCGRDCDRLREEVVKPADRRAAARWLEAWNRDHPEGCDGSYLVPDKYAHLGYARYKGPKLHVGYRPGGVLNKRPRRGSYMALAREERVLVLRPLGLDRWWWRKTWWDADHIVPVVEGGGGCGLDGLRTLCLPCHARETADLNSRRAKRRGRPRRHRRLPTEACLDGDSCRAARFPCRGCQAYRARVLGAGAAR